MVTPIENGATVKRQGKHGAVLTENKGDGYGRTHARSHATQQPAHI